MLATFDNATEAIAQCQETWLAHREVLRSVPLESIWRPYLGLAVALPERLDGFVPNEQTRWIRLFDLPRGRMLLHKPREFYCLMDGPMREHYAMPHLVAKGATQYDLRVFPGPNEHGQICNQDTLVPETDPRLFAVATILNVSMSAACVHYVQAFRPRKEAFYADVLEAEVNPGEHLVPLGEDEYLTESIPAEHTFLPRPYLGFRSPVAKIFELSVRPFPDNPRQCYYPPALVARFLDDYCSDLDDALPGLPPRWRHMPLRARWGSVVANLDREFLPTLETWFTCCARQVGQLNYLPADLVSPAARKKAVAGALTWDFTPCARYWRSSLGAYILPPIGLRGPQRLCGTWSGEIAWDLTPLDQRYREPLSSQHRKRRAPKS